MSGAMSDADDFLAPEADPTPTAPVDEPVDPAMLDLMYHAETVRMEDEAEALADAGIPAETHTDADEFFLHDLSSLEPPPEYDEDARAEVETRLSETEDQAAEKEKADKAKRQRGGFVSGLIRSVDSLVTLGKKIIAEGRKYVLDGLIPDYGMLGFFIGYAKIGKSTTGLKATLAIARGDAEFLGRAITKKRVLYLAIEDPEEYLAWMVANAATGGEDAIFYPHPLKLDEECLGELSDFVRERGVGLVYVATFAAGVKGLVKDENDNASMIAIVNSLKRFARSIGVPVLMEAHSGKGGSQNGRGGNDDDDPVKALRGASGAAGEADFLIAMKQAGAGTSTKRRISAAGRFVDRCSIDFDFDPKTWEVTLLGQEEKSAACESDFQFILAAEHALTAEARSIYAIAKAIGWSDEKSGKVSGAQRKRVLAAIKNREGVVIEEVTEKGKTVTKARLTA